MTLAIQMTLKTHAKFSEASEASKSYCPSPLPSGTVDKLDVDSLIFHVDYGTLYDSRQTLVCVLY